MARRKVLAEKLVAVHEYLSNSSPKAKDGAVHRGQREAQDNSSRFRSTLETFLDKHKITSHNKNYLT